MKISHQHRAASSVLIIIMMIVLISLGLAGLTLSLANERLADKKIDWLTDYYALESAANQRLAVIYHEIAQVNHNRQAFDVLATNLTAYDDLSIIEPLDDAPQYDKFISYNVSRRHSQYDKNIAVIVALTFDDINRQTGISASVYSYTHWQEPFEIDELFDLQ